MRRQTRRMDLSNTNRHPIIAETLQAWSLKANTLKTEWVTVSAADEDWRSVKQLGSLMGTPEDIKKRTQQAAIAFRRMYALWLRKDHVSIDRRVRLYKAFVLPAFLYIITAAHGELQRHAWIGQMLSTGTSCDHSLASVTLPEYPMQHCIRSVTVAQYQKPSHLTA